MNTEAVSVDFFDCDVAVTEIILACKVAAGTGIKVHNKRPSHGFALNIAGRKTYIFNDGKKLSVGENDIIFLPQGSSYVVDDEISGDCYAINFKICPNAVFSPFVLHIKKSAEITECFKEAEKCFSSKQYGYSYKCRAYLYSVFHIVVAEKNLKYISNDTKKMLLPAVNYIHSSYTKGDTRLEKAAELCKMSPSYFRKVFFYAYGQSPIKYINSLKLARAKELLAQNECSLENVSELSGFNNIYYFFRFFKKNLGVTPTEYRKKAMQGENNP